MVEKTPDVVIIGAGIVGCSIALALSKRGYATLNVDKLPAAGYGSTSHSSAIVRPIYSHSTSVALAHESRSFWCQWEEFIGPDAPNGYARYHECGGMILIKEGEEEQYQANFDALKEVGVDFEVISNRKIESLYPGIDLRSFGPPKPSNHPEFAVPTNGQITSGLFVKQAGYVSDPMLAADNLRFAAQKLGAQFRFDTQVTSIADNRISLEAVSRSGQNSPITLEARIIINASGPHSARINALASVDIPISTQPVRHEVVYLDSRNRHFENGGGFLADLDAGTYLRPDGTDIVIGSADPGCDEKQVVDPDDNNSNFSQQWMLQAMRAAQRFPELAIENNARGTVGIYDVSEDWVPIYDKSDKDHFFVAIGTSGNQFKNAPLIGEVMASIIERGNSHDKKPAKLFLRNINRTIDLSFFSRNRTIKGLSGVLA